LRDKNQFFCEGGKKNLTDLSGGAVKKPCPPGAGTPRYATGCISEFKFSQLATLLSGCIKWVVHNGREQRGEGSNADTCGQGRGAKDLADVHKLVLFCIIQFCFVYALYSGV